MGSEIFCYPFGSTFFSHWDPNDFWLLLKDRGICTYDFRSFDDPAFFEEEKKIQEHQVEYDSIVRNSYYVMISF